MSTVPSALLTRLSSPEVACVSLPESIDAPEDVVEVAAVVGVVLEFEEVDGVAFVGDVAGDVEASLGAGGAGVAGVLSFDVGLCAVLLDEAETVVAVVELAPLVVSAVERDSPQPSAHNHAEPRVSAMRQPKVSRAKRSGTSRSRERSVAT